MDPLLRDFPYLAIHIAGVVIVAALLRPLTRLVPGQYLVTWSRGWISLAISLIFLFVALHLPGMRVLAMIGFGISNLFFGWLLWVGCVELAHGQQPQRWHYGIAGVLVVLALIGPLFFPNSRLIFPFLAFASGSLFFLAFLTLWHYHPPGSTTGLWLIRVSLIGLFMLCWHYTVISLITSYVSPEMTWEYLSFWSLYDLFLAAGLALGMLVLATEQIQRVLEEKNQKLAEVMEDLARAARTDPLTGLLNRRALDHLIADSSGQPFLGVLGVIDLNNLKQLNDLRGHAAGDIALKLVARALRNHFRVTDAIFRTGGDEFLVILANGNEQELTSRFARVDAALQNLRLNNDDDGLDLSLAWGVASFQSAEGIPAAIDQADAAMYQRKKLRKQSRSLDLA